MTVHKVLDYTKNFFEGWISILPFMSKMPHWRPLFTNQVSSRNDWRLIGNDLTKVLEQLAAQCTQSTTQERRVNNEE